MCSLAALAPWSIALVGSLSLSAPESEGRRVEEPLAGSSSAGFSVLAMLSSGRCSVSKILGAMISVSYQCEERRENVFDSDDMVIRMSLMVQGRGGIYF